MFETALVPTVEQLQALLASQPDDTFLNFGLAMALAKDSRREEALAAFARTLELDANYVPAYFQKARVLLDAGRTEDAAATLRAGMEVARQVGDDHAHGEMAEFLATLE